MIVLNCFTTTCWEICSAMIISTTYSVSKCIVLHKLALTNLDFYFILFFPIHHFSFFEDKLINKLLNN